LRSTMIRWALLRWLDYFKEIASVVWRELKAIF
jgi:hypothetical protein